MSRKRLQRAQRRTLALQLALDSSLLREKEQEQLVQLHQHRLAEMADSRQFREQPPQLPPGPPLVPPEIQQAMLDRLLQPSPMERLLREGSPPPP